MGMFFGVLIHELGHLLGGAFAGLKVSVFRVGRIMFIRKTDGHMSLRLSEDKTVGGQCLLAERRRSGIGSAALALLGGAAANLLFTIAGAAAMAVLCYHENGQSAVRTVALLLLFDLTFWNLAGFMSAAVPGRGNDMSVFLEIAGHPSLIPAYFGIMELEAEKLSGEMNVRRYLEIHAMLLKHMPEGLLMENLLDLADDDEGEVEHEPARKAS